MQRRSVSSLLTSILLALSLLFSFYTPRPAYAQGADFVPANPVPDNRPGSSEMVLLKGGAEMAHLEAYINGLQYESRSGKGERKADLFAYFSGEGLGRAAAAEGAPDLPVLTQAVEVPLDAQVTVEILAMEAKEYSLAELGLPEKVYPTQPPDCKCDGEQPFVYDPVAYKQAGFQPGSPVQLGEAYMVRGHRAIPVQVWPVLYDAQAGRVRLITRLELRLNWQKLDPSLGLAQAERLTSPEFVPVLEKEMLNFNLGVALPTLADPVGYLIIVADAYAAAMAPFVQLQTDRGFTVTMTRLSQITPNTREGIKAYIQTAYTSWNPAPSYVLLVGDTDTIPAWNSQQSSGKYTDLYYATMDGTSDWHPDLKRGRFPVRSAAQATIMVNKYLAYHLLTGNEPWLKKAAYIATCDNYTVAEGSHNYAVSTYTQPEGYTGMFPANPQPGGDKIYCITHNGTATNIRNAANDGRWAIVYSGHGSETGWADGTVSFTQTDVRNLTDQGFYPFVASHACVTGSYNQTEAYGETWVLQENKGAIAFWGASHNTYWPEDDVLEKAWFDSLFIEGDVHPDLGTITDYSLSRVEAIYSSSARYYWEAYNIMGDPSVKVFLEPENPDFSLDANPDQIQVCSTGSATSTIAVNSVLNFASPVSLSASGAPAGVSAILNPTTVTPPSSSQLTLNVTSPQTGIFPITIQGTSGALSHSTQVNLGLFTTQPGTPVLSAPANASTNQPLRPVFSWAAAAQSGSYELQVATDVAFTNLVISVSGISEPTYTPTVDLNSNQLYYWRVRSMNACGTGNYSSAFNFITLPLPGDCTLGSTPVLLMNEGFEANPSGWTHSGTGDSWALSSTRVHSGASSIHANDTPTATDQYLVSPATVLPVGQNPLALRFWNYQDLEDRSSGCYDGGILEISTNNGSSWTQVTTGLLTDPYDGPMGTGTPITGQPAWCGNPQDWLDSIVDLSDYAGQTVRFRFRLATDGSEGYEGWYIDDVRLQSCPIATSYNASLGPDSTHTVLPLQTSVHSFTLHNLGLADEYTVSVSGATWPTVLLTPATNSLPVGGQALVQVQVTAPALDMAHLQVTDEFTVSAQSSGDPDLVLQTTGTTISSITPAVTVQGETQSAPPGQAVTHTVTVRNTGNYTDTFNVTISDNQWPTQGPSSVGPLGPGQSQAVPVVVQIPDSPLGIILGSDAFTFQAASTLDPQVFGSALIQTNAAINPGLTFGPAMQTNNAAPGSELTHTFWITNTGDYTDTFTLLLTGATWPAQAPASVGPLGSGQGAAVQVLVQVPAFTPLPGAASVIVGSDDFYLTATSGLDPSLEVQVRGISQAAIEADIEISPEAWSQAGEYGEVLTYHFVLTNTGSYTDVFQLAVNSNDWPAEISSDSARLGAGDTAEVDVTVQLPAESGASQSSSFTLTAVSAWDAQVRALASGTSWVAVHPGLALGPQQTQTGLPGTTLIYNFVLTNTGDYTDSFTLKLESSWDTQAPPEIGPLPPGGAQPVQVTVAIPLIEVGDSLEMNEFSLIAFSQVDNNVAAQVQAYSQAVVHPALEMSVLVPARTVGAGQVVTYTVFLTNTGDYSDQFALHVSEAQWTVRAPALTPVMQPGDVAVVRVGVQAPAAQKPHALSPANVIVDKDSFKLTAVSAWDEEVSDWVKATTSVKAALGATLEISGGEAAKMQTALVGTDVTYVFTVTNTGEWTDAFVVEVNSDWPVTLSLTQTEPIAPGESQVVHLTVHLPLTAPDGSQQITTIRFGSMLDSSLQVEMEVVTQAEWRRVFVPCLRR